jgi:hypothetical protein
MGYLGMAGEAIPQVARIVSVADVFDALISERPTSGPGRFLRHSPKSKPYGVATSIPRSSMPSSVS